MKSQIKSGIGKVLAAMSTNPVGRASLNQEGYSCVPTSAIEMMKSLDKQEDIRKYPAFGSLAESIVADSTSCLYYDRLYTIYQCLANLKGSSRKVTTVEVGVYKGGTSRFMAEAMNSFGMKYSHHAFDTFEGHDAKDITKNDTHKASQFGDTSYEAVKEYLESYPDVTIYKGRFEDTCKLISWNDVEFVYLDVDLYAPTLHALGFFTKRMQAGSIILVDDYGTLSCPGVRQAVDEFLAKDGSFVHFHLLTGQKVLVKVK
jgi:O-methyltransferase